ncbi:MAG: tRNA (N6-isopentenyl adenosine(37)-C2)-methylthiotransferase MiaB [Elusimicrobiota bacterium]
MEKYYIKTFGCQMNIADSDFMADALAGLGMQPAQDLKEADIIVVNTCSVRDHAEHRALSYVGRLKPLKKRNPKLKIVFAGCAAERLGKNMKSRFQMVDEVIGAKSIDQFPQILAKILGSKLINPSPVNPDYSSGLHNQYSGSRRLPSSDVSAFVTIMRGCENFCSYCIVPYVRGKEISRPAGEIIEEITHLAGRGVKEVTLLGQNVNSYKDCLMLNVTCLKKKTTDFTGLLEMVNGIEGIERIRFMTSHPKDSGSRLVSAMNKLDKVCEHLHLPLQSGSDKILKLMNRGYTAGDYLDIIKDFRSKMPEGGVTTDILIGFPGETEADFKKTLAMVKKIRFDFLFAFKYSPRPGTEADKLKDNVPRETKEKRHAEILETANKISVEKNAKLIGTVWEVLVEEIRDGICSGMTRTNKKVYFPSDKKSAGETALVRIISGKINSLSGTEV